MAEYESDDKALLERAKRCFKLVTDAESKQRKREQEDIEFQVDQWEPEARNERKGRPILSIDLIQQPMQLVQNQAANARLGVNLHHDQRDGQPRGG